MKIGCGLLGCCELTSVFFATYYSQTGEHKCYMVNLFSHCV